MIFGWRGVGWGFTWGRVGAVVPDLLPKSLKSVIRQKSSALCPNLALIVSVTGEFEELQVGEKAHSLGQGSASAV